MLNLLDLVIESERLRLVATDEAYADDIFREFTAEITTFMGPKPPDSVEETLSFIRGAREKMARGEDLPVAIILKESVEFIGHGGIDDLGTRTPELGIWIRKGAQGHKYGREAVTALAIWARDNLEFDYLKYPVDRRNAPSRAIPESLGGVIEADYEWTNLSGRQLYLLEYRIYPSALDALRSA